MSPICLILFTLVLGTLGAPMKKNDRAKRQFGLGYGGGGYALDRARLAQDQLALAETQAERMALNLREAALLERTRFDAARLRLNRYGGGLGGGLGGFSPYGRPGLGLGFGSGLGSPLGGLGLGLGGINIVV